MSPPPAGGKDSHAARILGSGTSGIAELIIFHPVDTVAKRLMSNKVSGMPMMQVVFREHATAPAGRKLLSLFPGLGYAAGYKDRFSQFGGQPYFNDFLSKNFKTQFSNTFGEKNGKAMMSATAGSLTGIGEIVLLPLDVLKIKRQTNPEAFRSRGFVQIVRDEGFGLYRGASWTAARNAPGSFALFGGSAFTKEYVFGLQDYRSATWYQNFVASIAGSVSSIAISQPLDVIKTRIQNQNFESKVGGMTVVRDLIKHEGFSAFFKGLTPKVLVVGPKLIFSFTLAQSLIPWFSNFV
uniref:BY PROTMAP: gi/472580275/gb/EMS18094.1/ mitochondrial carrier protein, GTP/GDP transporter [Rhodosporidium toruloides NP11] gi/647403735/emb/CDR49812.1/ RHTO0S34e00452g1_1 [Rhodosporidium toruloides] n=1 Tax=Rhodotorula toruloides TaxID=5286 RepID=A0A0K3CHC0_RHOTO